jgi:hypothetical protein
MQLKGLILVIGHYACVHEFMNVWHKRSTVDSFLCFSTMLCNHDFFVLVLCTQVNMMFVMLLWVYISTPGKLEKYACPPWPGIFFKLARCGYTLRVTSQMLCKFMFTCMYLLQLSVKRNPPKIPESDRPPSKLCSSPLCFFMQLLYPVLYSFWWYAMPYGEIALNLLIYKLQFGYCTINKLF